MTHKKSFLRSSLEVAGLVALLAVLMLWLAGAFHKKIEPGPLVPSLAPEAGARAPVVSHSYTDVVEQVGTVRSRYLADVASKLLAQVTQVRVEAGDHVRGPGGTKPPTVVAVLDSRDLRAQLARAEANARATDRGIEVQKAQVAAAKAALAAAKARLDRAEADFARYQSLVSKGVATPEQLDQVRAARDVALADLTEATNQVQAGTQQLARAQEEHVVAQRQVEESNVLLGYTTISAPFSGIVTERLVDVGDTVQPGQALVRVEDPTQLELNASVAESLAADLSLGQRLAVRIDALRVTLEGKIREIAPSADPASRTLRVKVSLPRCRDLVSGLFGRLEIPVGHYQALVVPRKAVREVGELQLVDSVGMDGRLHRRFVTLGRTHGDVVEVLSGLSAGEEVALP